MRYTISRSSAQSCSFSLDVGVANSPIPHSNPISPYTTLTLYGMSSFHFLLLDRCRTCNIIARFCCATLSRDKIAIVTCRVAQLLNSLATHFSIRAALYFVQICRENAVNADWSLLVHATKVAVCDTACHTCDFVAR